MNNIKVFTLMAGLTALLVALGGGLLLGSEAFWYGALMVIAVFPAMVYLGGFAGGFIKEQFPDLVPGEDYDFWRYGVSGSTANRRMVSVGGGIELAVGGVQGLALTDRHLFVVNRNRILRYDFDGSLTATLDLEPFGDARPQRLAIDGDRLFLPDLTGDRILLADTALTSPALHHAFENGSLVLSWNSTTAAPGSIEVRTDDGFTLERTASRSGTASR